MDQDPGDDMTVVELPQLRRRETSRRPREGLGRCKHGSQSQLLEARVLVFPPVDVLQGGHDPTALCGEHHGVAQGQAWHDAPVLRIIGSAV